MNCDIPDCVICAWLCNRLIQFNEEMMQAILESAPPPVTFYRWLPGDPE